MFNLKAGVHLQKVEIILIIENKLDRSGPCVTGGLGKFTGCPSHFLTQLFSQRHRRRLLYDLLVTSLNGTLALTEVNYVSELVSHNLDFNVSGPHNETFHKYPVVPEALHGLSPAGFERFRQFFTAHHDTHSTPTAACRRFQ